MSSAGIVKIADFGLSKNGDAGSYLTTVAVTLWYRSLEVILGQPYNQSADLWSVGMVMCQIYTRLPLIHTKTEMETIGEIVAFLGMPNESIWPQTSNTNICIVDRKQFEPLANYRLEQRMQILCTHGFNLLRHLLDYNIEQRYKAFQTLTHPFFNSEVCRCGYQIGFPPPLESS